MARSFLAFALTSLLPASLIYADPTPTPTSTPDSAVTSAPDGPPLNRAPGGPGGAGDWRGRKDKGGGGRDMGPGWRSAPDGDADGSLARFKKRIQQMSPEDRQRFQENLQRWKQMGAVEQKDWQARAQEERDRMKKIIDDTIDKLGLKLDDDQREVFVLRYRQERRKIEEQLCKEMAEKRDKEVDDMLQRLKAEFSAPKPTPAASATPTP